MSVQYILQKYVKPPPPLIVKICFLHYYIEKFIISRVSKFSCKGISCAPVYNIKQYIYANRTDNVNKLSIYVNISTEVQEYPQRIRLKRRLYKIYSAFFKTLLILCKLYQSSNCCILRVSDHQLLKYRKVIGYCSTNFVPGWLFTKIKSTP